MYLCTYIKGLEETREILKLLLIISEFGNNFLKVIFIILVQIFSRFRNFYLSLQKKTSNEGKYV